MGIKVLGATVLGGKTRWAVEKSREDAAGLMSSPYVLLPSKTQVDDFKRRLANHGGAMGVYLGTFRELSQEIIDRSEKNLTVITETAQIKLLRTILESLSLTYYQRIKHKPGFAQTMLAIFRELEAGKIESKRFHHAVKELDQDGRLGEIALVYQEYQNQLQENNWVDPTGLVWMAVNILADQPEKCPEWDSLIVDGFDDLSPIQLDLIISLSRIIPDVSITITGTKEGSERPLVHKRFNQLKMELEDKGPVDLVRLEEPKDERTDGFFEKLEGVLFSSVLEGPLDPGDKIKLVAVPDREGEVRTAFRWIKELISVEDIEYGETAIIMRNLEPYRKIIDKVAGEYQLPVFIKGGLPLNENPAIAAILSLLNLANSEAAGLLWHDVISIWQSPYFDWDVLTSEIDIDNRRHQHLVDAKQLSDIARWGSVIQGYDQWKEAFERLIAEPYGDQPFSSRSSVPGHIPTGEAAENLWSKFGSFVELIRPPEKGLKVEEYLTWVENLLGDLNLDEERTIGLNLYQMARDGGPDLFQRDCQAIKKLTEIFREYIRSDLMFGTGQTTFNSVLEDLESEIARQSYQVAEDKEDLIICADCTELRGISFKAVALIGLAEGEFPGTIKEDPFLRNEDRSILQDKYEFPLRSSTESAEPEFFYEAVLRASDYLLITRPRIADNGAPWQPSPYWEEILRTVDLAPEMQTSRSVPSLLASASRSELFEGIAAAGSGNQKELLKEAREIYPKYFSQIAVSGKVINAREGKSGSNNLHYDGKLEYLTDELHSRFPEEHVWSASRLENYQSCPFNFFVNNLLDLENPEPPQEGLDARQLGNIYHHIMEDLYLEVGINYDINMLLALAPDIAAKVFEDAPRREGFRETAWWHHTQQEILTNIKHSLIVLEGLDKGFTFYRAEQKFGIRNDSAPQLDIEVEGEGTYHLRGLIDRVDIDPQGNLRIIDYKTSSPFGFDNQAVREGKKLQLPLYALAAQEGLQLGNVKEGFYFHVRSAQASIFKMSTFRNFGDRGSLVAIKIAKLKGWQAVSSIKRGMFSPRPPDNGCPVYCPAINFCWHYKRKIW